MSFKDIRIELTRISTHTGVDEITKVITATLEFLHQVEFLVINRAVGVGTLNQVTFRPVKDDPDLIPPGGFEEIV